MTKYRLYAIGLLLCAIGLAQLDRGTITGILTDSSGARVPGVRIAAKNTATNAIYEAATTSAGEYTVVNLPSGTYDVTFEASGLKKLVRSKVLLAVSETVRIDAVLQVGDTKETVEVSAQQGSLQTESAVTGQFIENRQVVDMPLSFSGGRNPQNFAFQLGAGVSGGSGGAYVNGTSSFGSAVLIDGATATGYRSGDLSQDSPSPEAVQEFKTETSGMSAEYGRAMGGVFNFVMKSGANQIHGTGMGALRNESMDARSFSNNYYNLPKSRDRQNDEGGSFGGPVYIPKIYNGKDKTFFYFAYERFHTSTGGASTPNQMVPPPSWLNGDMSNYLTSQSVGKDALGNSVLRGAIYDPDTTQTVNGQTVRFMFPGNVIPASRISTVSKRVIALMAKDYPATVPGPNGDFLLANNAFAGYDTWQNYTQMSVKADHNIGSRNHLSGSLARTSQPYYNAAASGIHVWNSALQYGGPFTSAIIKPVNTYFIRIADDHSATPTVFNHFGIYVNRVTNSIQNLHQNDPNPLLVPNTPTTNTPQVNWSGGDRFSLTNLGQDKMSDSVKSLTYGWQDTLSWVKGRHTLKLGVEYRVYKLNYYRQTDPGSFTFSVNQTGMPGLTQYTGHPFASFLLGDVNNASITITTPTMAIYKSWGAFVQDDFKVSPTFTLNLGMRWDYAPVQTEEHNRLFSFSPTATDPATGLPGALIFAGNCPVCNQHSGFVDNTYHNFGPRIGFAWQVARKSTIRAGYGVFFADRAPNDYFGDPTGATTNNGWGWGAANVVNYPNNNMPAFNWDNGYPGVTTLTSPNPSQADSKSGPLSWVPNGGRLGYNQSWNLNVQRELPFGLLADVGYVGTKASALEANALGLLNQLPPSALALGSTLSNTVTSQAAIPAAAQAMGARYPYGSTGQSVAIWQTLLPFPQLYGGATAGGWNAPLGFSNYNALQVQLNKRFSHGLSWIANYTFSKAISNVSNLYYNGTGNPMVASNLALQKAISSYDQPQVVKVGVNYDLPFGRGKSFGHDMNRWLDVAVGGWKILYIGNYNSGTPLSFGANAAASGTNLSTNRASLTNPAGTGVGIPFNSSTFNMAVLTAPSSQNQYLNKPYIVQPAPYTFGTSAPYVAQIRGFWGRTENIAIQKNFAFKERARFQMRLETFNAFNRHTFGGIQTNPNATTFGQVTSVSGNRTVQLGARVDF